jgi:DNA-binding NtrC family response regulator
VTAGILFGSSTQPAEIVAPAAPTPTPTTPISLDGRLRDLETTLISWALKASHGNKSKAAELLQIKRSTLGDRIKHCGLDRAVVTGRETAGDDATAA